MRARQVITEGVQKVRPGQVVQATESKKSEAWAMLSGIFIERPRLAIVISLVITIAGLSR